MQQMGRIPIENNRFISRDTQTHPSETAMTIYIYIYI